MSLFVNAIKGRGKPTENTQGYVGRHYVDMDTGTEYVCVRVDNHDTHKPVTSRPHDFVHVDTFIAKTKYVWEARAEIPETVSDEIEMLIEANLLPAVSTVSGAILTDNSGNVILRY
jgi:hypothetical protein